MKDEKRTMVACLIGVVVYLCLTLFLLAQTGCAGWQPPNELNPVRILNCTSVVNNCVAQIKEAHQLGDGNQIAVITAQCVIDWDNAGCTDLIEKLTLSIQDASKDAGK